MAHQILAWIKLLILGKIILMTLQDWNLYHYGKLLDLSSGYFGIHY